MGLETRLEQTFDRLGIEAGHKVQHYLGIMRARDEETYAHSVRVALKGVQISEFIGLDPKVLLYAGCLHDVGKALVPGEVLRRPRGLSPEDWEHIWKHPVDSYRLLRGVFDFTANIVVRHHRFQAQAYPAILPDPRVSFGEAANASINFYARLLALADFYDALTTREDGRFIRTRGAEGREILLTHNVDQSHLIMNLYGEKIFK